MHAWSAPPSRAETTDRDRKSSALTRRKRVSSRKKKLTRGRYYGLQLRKVNRLFTRRTAGASLGWCRQNARRAAVARFEHREEEVVRIGDERGVEVGRNRD